MEILKREKASAVRSGEDRLQQSDKVEGTLRQEVAALKSQVETLRADFEHRTDEMREATKTRVARLEREKKDMEVVTTQLRHTFSIEEAKWNMKAEQQLNESS